MNKFFRNTLIPQARDDLNKKLNNFDKFNIIFTDKCSELVYTVVYRLTALLYYLIGLKHAAGTRLHCTSLTNAPTPIM